jgi:hypothetical protein
MLFWRSNGKERDKEMESVMASRQNYMADVLNEKQVEAAMEC